MGPIFIVHDAAGRMIIGEVVSAVEADTLKLLNPMVIQVNINNQQINTGLFPLFQALEIDQLDVKWIAKSEAKGKWPNLYENAVLNMRASKSGIQVVRDMPKTAR